MKYNIYIKVSDYLSNGGDLGVGRNLFSFPRGVGNPGHNMIGQVQSTNPLIVKNNNGTYQFPEELAYVLVECKPIYK